MTRTRTAAASIAAAFAFSALALGSAPAAHAGDDTSTAACSTQQAQLDRATAKLADLQAKYAAHPTKKLQKAKKAQAQRVAHAQARLDDCLAASA